MFVEVSWNDTFCENFPKIQRINVFLEMSFPVEFHSALMEYFLSFFSKNDRKLVHLRILEVILQYSGSVLHGLQRERKGGNWPTLFHLF